MDKGLFAKSMKGYPASLYRVGILRHDAGLKVQ